MIKLIGKIFAVSVASAAVAFVWWAVLPAPPELPDKLLLPFEPVVVWAAGKDVHAGEELLSLIEIGYYVAALALILLMLARLRRRNRTRSVSLSA